jgi:hypothetical protein
MSASQVVANSQVVHPPFLSPVDSPGEVPAAVDSADRMRFEVLSQNTVAAQSRQSGFPAAQHRESAQLTHLTGIVDLELLSQPGRLIFNDSALQSRSPVSASSLAFSSPLCAINPASSIQSVGMAISSQLGSFMSAAPMQAGFSVMIPGMPVIAVNALLTSGGPQHLQLRSQDEKFQAWLATQSSQLSRSVSEILGQHCTVSVESAVVTPAANR